MVAPAVSPLACFLGWCLATVLFIGLIVLLGGPASNDSYQTVLSTWAVQHGQLACAFPTGDKVTAPLYPLVSGGIAAIERVGQGVPFPPRAALGPDCDRAFLAINTWSLRANAQAATIRIGYLSWFVLMGGLVAVLRRIGRGRCGWEPTTLVIVASLPPVWLCLEGSFHPEDLVAMGFALGAVALAGGPPGRGPASSRRSPFSRSSSRCWSRRLSSCWPPAAVGSPTWGRLPAPRRRQCSRSLS